MGREDNDMNGSAGSGSQQQRDGSGKLSQSPTRVRAGAERKERVQFRLDPIARVECGWAHIAPLLRPLYATKLGL